MKIWEKKILSSFPMFHSFFFLCNTRSSYDRQKKKAKVKLQLAAILKIDIRGKAMATEMVKSNDLNRMSIAISIMLFRFSSISNHIETCTGSTYYMPKSKSFSQNVKQR